MIARLVFLAALLATASAATPSHAVASAELIYTVPYTYGRFEARIAYAPGDGVVSSFFLWKEGSEVAGTFWNELDFEKVEADCRVQTNALYGNPVVNTSQFDPIAGDLCGSYHDYLIEWAPDYIAWAVDGQEIRRETGEIATAFAQNASGGMTFHFNVWPGNEEFGGNFDPAVLPVHQYISWVQYSSYQGGSFQVEWREEFDGGLPSNWSLGSWGSPKGLSTHAAANVNFVNGSAVLSVTADDATGFSGTPLADDAGTTGSGGGTGGSDGSDMTSMGGANTANMSNGSNSVTTGLGGAATNVGGASTVGPNTASSNAAMTTGAMTGVGGAASGGTTVAAAADSTTGSGGSESLPGDSASTASGDWATTAGAEGPAAEEAGCACRLSGRGGRLGGPPMLAVALAAAALVYWRRWRTVASRAARRW